jgi:hypothetical protein
MFASVFTARKATGYKFELVIHSCASLCGDSITAQYFYNSKAECRKAAAIIGAKPYNF